MAQETSGLTEIDRNERDSPMRLGNSENEGNGDGENVISEDTERLHSEIEETRENLGETIDAIQERLSLANLSEQVSERVNSAIETAKETAYDATIGKAVNFMKQAGDGVMRTSAAQTVKANPVPFALIGIGSAMLMYNGFSKKNRRNGSRYQTTNYLASRTGQGASTGMTGSGAAGISDRAGDAYEAISEKASTAYDTVANTANQTYSTAANAANRAMEKVSDLGSSAKENYEYYKEEKPLAIAAAAMAVGAAIGLAIPSSRYEGELMGEASENLRAKAEDTASELVDKAKQVASDASQAVTKEIGSQTNAPRNA